MASILELRASDQARKDEILLNLYGVSDAAALRAASTKTNDEIVSAIGNGLIDALRVLRPVGTGCFLFSTTRPTSGTIIVRSSTGYARIVFSDNTTTGNASGTGSSTSNITLTIPPGTVHRPYAVIATANSTGTTASGNITLVTINSRNIHAINVSGLSACTNLSLGNNRLTSFSGTGLSACTTLDLNSNLLTSFSGTGLSVCTTLDLTSNPLTSFSGTGLSACTTLFLTDNALTSFNGSSLSSLYTLDLNGNSSVLETFTLNVNSFQVSGSFIGISTSVQTTESLNMILSALPPTDGVGDIDIRENPGSLTCNPELAASDWYVLVSG